MEATTQEILAPFLYLIISAGLAVAFFVIVYEYYQNKND